MHKKQISNIVILPKIVINDEETQERYCFQKLKTYIPWRKEDLNLLNIVLNITLKK